MDNLQLGTTIVVPTGTGNLYVPRGGDPADVASYQFGSGSTRSVLTLARTQPKPTATFAGVERFSMKLARYALINTDEQVVSVMTITTSIPVGIADADKVLFRDEGVLACLAPALATSPTLLGIRYNRLPT